MLKVVGRAAARETTVKTPSYLPLRFEVQDSAPYTWEQTWHGYILTVGIAADTATPSHGVIAMLDELRNSVPPEYVNARQVPGLPMFDVSEFKALAADGPPVIEVQREFAVFGDGRSISVALSTVDPDECLRCGRVGFYVGSGCLCGLGFFDLSDDEYAHVLSMSRRIRHATIPPRASEG